MRNRHCNRNRQSLGAQSARSAIGRARPPHRAGRAHARSSLPGARVQTDDMAAVGGVTMASPTLHTLHTLPVSPRG
eukprot:scaffold8459_cov121-Isochrysis_galbana.AAC.4